MNAQSSAQLLFGFLHLKDKAAVSGSLQEKCNAIFQEKRLEALEQAHSLLPSVVMACETAWWLCAGKHNILLKGLGSVAVHTKKVKKLSLAEVPAAD